MYGACEVLYWSHVPLVLSQVANQSDFLFPQQDFQVPLYNSDVISFLYNVTAMQEVLLLG